MMTTLPSEIGNFDINHRLPDTRSLLTVSLMRAPTLDLKGKKSMPKLDVMGAENRGGYEP